jgi:hypothetical protein
VLARNQKDDDDRVLKARPSRLLADYQRWARANGEPAMTSTEFKESLERAGAGLRLGRTGKTGQWAHGIALNPLDEDEYAPRPEYAPRASTGNGSAKRWH